MRGEGDILRHLKLLGCEFLHEQSFLEEFDYRVKNLAIDLRDGIRLNRLVEVVAQIPSNELMSALLVPAENLTRKRHNVKLALQKLRTLGLPIGFKKTFFFLSL